uniref:Uncharacterized protein n=1 Tax=Meloidogyne hapla TaxID=6305 RepID=A0A1I8BK28_MELHA
MLDISYKINNNNQLISTTTNIQNKKTNNRQYTVPLSSPKSPQKSLENKNISQSLLPIYLNQKTFFPFFSTNIQQKPKLCAKLSDKIKNIKQNENKQLNGYFEEEEERIRRFSIADLAEAALRHQRHQKQLYRSVAVIECCQQQNNQQKCPTANFYIKCLCKENKIKINKTKNTFSSLSRGPSLLRHRRRLFSQYQQKRNCSSSGTHPRPSSRNSGSFFSSTEEKCNGDLTQPSSILVNSSGGGCNYINNNCLSTTLPPLNNEINTKSLEWSPTIEEKILNKKTDQTNILQQRQQQILRRRQSGYGISITTESQAKMRCKLRKLYFLKRNKICDLSLALAIIG